MSAFPSAVAVAPNPAVVLARHALGVSADNVPPSAVAAAKRLLLDTLGVGVAGARAPFAQELLTAAAAWGDRAGATPILGRPASLPPHAAAFVNAFQIHAQEFDCVHERAVVHPLATLVAALIADTARLPPTDGPTLLAAMIAGVDVAATLGLAARSPLKFFRPSTAGIFGCVAAMARIRQLDVATTVAAFGHALAFTSGTMQAHVEGTPGLALQIANAARNALVAIDLAVAGLPAAAHSIDGPFGYLRLFEDRTDLTAGLKDLGKVFRISEVSQKPYPTGRAAHGALFAVDILRATHGVSADNLQRLTYRAPPLIGRLVGRRIDDVSTPNGARLCFAYLGAVALLRGTVGLKDFSPAKLGDPVVRDLAARIEVTSDGNTDPAAFTPGVASALLRDGRIVTVHVDRQPGSPAMPLTRSQALDKFRACVEFANGGESAGQRLLALPERIDRMDSETDVRRLWHPDVVS